MTRPNIFFPLSVVRQFINSSCDNHWDVVIQITKYIKESPRKGLVFCYRDNIDIIRYYVDLTRDASDRWSTSGYCVFIC